MQQNRSLGLIVTAVAVLAVAAAGVFIFLSNNAPSQTGSGGFGDVPRTRLEDGGYVIGSLDAPITIVEFADFLCPHCQDYKAEINRFIQEYVTTGQARFEYRMFPVIDPRSSTYAAAIVECVDNQRPGAFWDAYDVMFELTSSQRFNADTARVIAERTNVSYPAIVNCTSDAAQWQTDYALGQQAGVQGTPAVMMRDASGQLQWISFGGRTYDRGGVPFEVLAGITAAAQQQ
jgi:protein-disulfide isomerase